MRVLGIMLALLMLGGCGGSSKPLVENPFALQVQELSRNGARAIRQENWQSAINLYARALSSARLANREDMVAQAFYNLGAAQLVAGKSEEAERSFSSGILFSVQHHQKLAELRSRIALALIEQNRGQHGWQAESSSRNYPADVHLSLGRLAYLQQRYDTARHEYSQAIKQSGPEREGLLYRATAHMGLAQIDDRLDQRESAGRQLDEVLKISRIAGTPRLAAHALVLKSKYAADDASRQILLRDAKAIYAELDVDEEVSAEIRPVDSATTDGDASRSER